MENRIENLETKISYQEHLIQELNDVIISQQNQIDKVEKTLQQLKGYMQNHEGDRITPEQEAPPPHY